MQELSIEARRESASSLEVALHLREAVSPAALVRHPRTRVGITGDDSLQAVFDAGHEVGKIACERFPGGRLVAHDHLHIPEALEET